MAGGLVALLDDVAVLARAAAASVDDIGLAAAKASAKAAGVVVDDTAVTPQYVQGLAAEREVPIVRRIAIGSLRNKLLIILPAILLLSQFAEVLLTPLLMLGGAYLCFEGAEKAWERLRGHTPADLDGPVELPDEKTIVKGAVRTDFILSSEIMVISLNEVVDESFALRAAILVVVAIAITVLVYGVVALIVKMDDLGLSLAARPGEAVAAVGRGLVKAMPKLLSALTLIGTAAMLWVGGHILLIGTHELGWDLIYDAVKDLEKTVDVGALGGLAAWLVDTAVSALIGLVVGAVLVVVITLTLHRGGDHQPKHGAKATAAQH